MIDFASLQKYSLFGGFRSEDIERIRPLLSVKTYRAGETVIRERERNDSVYFILQGEVRVVKEGMRIIDLGEGDSFGEIEVLDVMPAAAAVEASSPLTAAVVSNRALHQLYLLDPKLFALFVMNLARDLARRLRRMDERACEDERRKPLAQAV